MSYILEALRKSQQDREIGQVPTLATQPLFMSQESGGNFRGLAAMALAGLAVAIALYAALRAGPEVAPPTSTLVPPMTQTAGPAPGGVPVVAPAPGASPALPATPAPTLPPLAGPGTVPVPAAPPAVTAGSAPPAPPPVQLPAREDEDLADARLDDTGDAPEGSNEGSVVAPSPPDGIPEDLRQDIQSFKEQLKEGQGSKAAKKASTPKQLSPQERRLPREVEQRLPSFLLTVHIYDAEPAKRFVVIDGRKLRQGDSSRGGILVEEILPDGVALSFEGHQ
ncbi:MAG: general secretion pathway protein GspB, partial [Chromatiaceae bacterium]|nr:general secretion pathway protein GspB [Chromatiaceae bacterium]